METYLTSFIQLLALVLGFAVISISATRIAEKFQQVNLPVITGFLLTGILCGPYILDLIRIESIDKLNFINEIALAFIAFAAGAELYLRELRSRFDSIKWNTIGQLSFTFVIGALAVFSLESWIPFMKDLSFNSKLAASLLTGTIFVARSPASAIAIINELRAKGPFTQTVMGVTVLKDFIVIILFAGCMSLGVSLVRGSEFNALSIILPITEIALSLGVGYFLGKVLNLFLSIQWKVEIKALGLILIGYLVYVLNHQIHEFSYTQFGIEFAIEPLIICIIASFYVTNYTRHRPEFFVSVKIIRSCRLCCLLHLNRAHHFP